VCAQCRVRLLLGCVQRTVQNETVIGLCTVQSETVTGVCTVHIAGCECYYCVYSTKCRVRRLLVCVQCTV
jgi:hypothetical protein